MRRHDSQTRGVVRRSSKYKLFYDVEVWNLPISCFGSFVAQIKKPLGIGSVALDDGSVYPGFLCESYATEGSQEISHLGGWREYLSFTNDAKGCLLD